MYSQIGPCFGSKTRAKVKKMKLLTITTLTIDREIQGGNMPASLLYTICFCFQGDSVLMLFRNKPPNAQRWNGLGGKFQPGETPLACIQREIKEEAGIDLHLAERLHFAGIVTWGSGVDPTSASTGMYSFIAHFPPTFPTSPADPTMPQGLLSCHPITCF